MPSLSEFPAWFLFAFGVPFGLAWGSFINVVIYRLPRGESVVSPPSHCPACGARIRASDNLPFFGFLLLRGKARCCGVAISPRYPLVELLGGLLAAALIALVVKDLPPNTSILRALGIFVAYLALGLMLIALTFIDLEHMLLPDSLTLGAAAIGFCSAPLRDVAISDAAIGAVIGFSIVYLPFDLLHRLIRGYPGMGLGDAKLTLLAGAWFGWKGAVFALLAGAIQATIIALAVIFSRGKLDEPAAVVREREALEAEIASAEGDARRELERERELDPMMRPPEPGLGKMRLPFGPFLALATLEYALFEHAGLSAFLDGAFTAWS